MPAHHRVKPADTCPCGTPRDYAACCGRWHAGLPAPDAEALMRSRYTAYVRGDVDYLRRTWHPDTRPPDLGVDSDPGLRWLGLSVRHHRQLDTNKAEVEFVARLRRGGGSAQRLHERSRFVHEAGEWLYVDGDLLE